MKKKLLLGILASAIALTLAVGGTFMLFTSTSDVQNVATFGNLEVELWEEGPDGETNEGIDYGEIVPGDELQKEPFFRHTSGVEAYLRMIVTVTVEDSNEEFGQWRVADQILHDLPINAPTANAPGWVRVSLASDEAGFPVAIYEYQNLDGSLAELQRATESTRLFNLLVINRDFTNAHVADKVITVDIFGQAVQSANNARTADNEPFSVFN
jgi:predicted ribosomally synthesized peptide with SipW-like signal peptide